VIFFIPGPLVGAATFPGVIVHEAAHQLACRLRGVPVLDVKYFQFANPNGYVLHGRTDDFVSTFAITIGPFVVNTLLCLLICLPAFVPVYSFDHSDPLSFFLIWLGISIGMHAFPSNQDASQLWEQALKKAKDLHPLALLSLPLVGLVYVMNIGRFFWLDALYGVGVGLGLPLLLLKAI
jgi:hypothetical protein